MPKTNVKTIAIREAAHAVLAEVLHTGTVVIVSVVPGKGVLGFVQTEPGETIPTATALENRITSILARAVVPTIGGADTTVSSSLESVGHMAKRLADMQVPDWRQTQPNLADEILTRCRTRAKELVAAQKDRILKVAKVLAEKGSLTGEELAAI
jgi:ATP-dependent Zn protease